MKCEAYRFDGYCLSGVTLKVVAPCLIRVDSLHLKVPWVIINNHRSMLQLLRLSCPITFHTHVSQHVLAG